MPGLRTPRRRRPEDGRRPRRSTNAIWLLFWLILVIVLLGLLFGGYRKGNKETGSPLPAPYRVAAVHPVGAGADR